jgi:ribosomal protein S12 methylthiotransferase
MKTKTRGEPKAPEASLRVALLTLGCAKNMVDSERMLATMGSSGLTLCESPLDAQVLLVNTCGFIDSAKNQSLEALQEAIQVKKSSSELSAVIATGCLAEHWGKKLLEKVPGLDGVIGLYHFEELPHLVRKIFRRSQGDSPLVHLKSKKGAFQGEGHRFRLTPSHYAYLKISEGCNHQCAFCTIPSFRGRHRSKPRAALLEEARELVADGVRELILIGQDTTYYGKDLEKEFTLPSLLRDLNEIEELRWIRLLYTYPACFTQELRKTIHETEKVLPYVDMPLQHISDPMLKQMRRQITKKQIQDLLQGMRQDIPHLALRTTFIVGFPGESEEDFAELCDFVEETRFECMGVFTYSDEEGTPAYGLSPKISKEVMEERREKLMLLQQRLVFERNEARVGERAEVLVDGIASIPGYLEARSYAEAPDIDGVLYLPLGSAEAGDFLEVEFTESQGYDLLVKPLEERRE